MTLCVILNLIDKYKLNSNKVKVSILESSTTPIIGGTSAELIKGDLISVHELMYAMMLPSGNDSA